MRIGTFIEEVIKKANEFGMVETEEGRKKKNVVIRKNINPDAGNVPYFGFIRPEEQASGPYSDFSLVFLPTPVEGKFVMTLGVGSEGFRNDYLLATQPGTRRMFLSLLPKDANYASFCKIDFSDIESTIAFDEPIVETEVNLEKYKSVLQIGCLIDAPKDIELVYSWVAQYAALRGWGTTKLQRQAIDEAISKSRKSEEGVNQKKEVEELLAVRQFVVLQGAPGTGKTYLAEEIGEGYNKTFLIQFHAETSYSDFVEGIMPALNSDTIKYESKKGMLVEALEFAIKNKDKKALLIVDEINRANLANVLGPVFYLFEPKRKVDSSKGVKIGDETINKIPENLHVVATMNTADRSIAVVDFALRRRFAWYTIAPRCFEGTIPAGKELFDKVASIFEKHATDEEMNLQPGGSYFMADNQQELDYKIEYELMPLVKEYLDEGLLASAKNEFFDLFYQLIHKPLYR